MTDTQAVRMVPIDTAQHAANNMRIAYHKTRMTREVPVSPDDLSVVLDFVKQAAAPSVQPGAEWQEVSAFMESGQNNPVIVAVPTKEGEWIIGEAWKCVMDSDDAYRGNDGWWWAGTSPGDYHADPIRFMNHGDVTWWQPLPQAPALQPVAQKEEG